MFVNIHGNLINTKHILVVKCRNVTQRDTDNENLHFALEIWYYKPDHPGMGQPDLTFFFEFFSDRESVFSLIERSRL